MKNRRMRIGVMSKQSAETRRAHQLAIEIVVQA